MFVHIGNNIILRQEDIIGVYNIKAIKNTNEYINIINKLTKEKKLMKKEDSEENTLKITEKNKNASQLYKEIIFAITSIIESIKDNQYIFSNY